MVHGNANCTQLGAWLLIIPTIALEADQRLMFVAIGIKRYSEDRVKRVKYTRVCCIVLTGAAARYTLSRRQILTKRYSLLCRAKKSASSTLRSGSILLEMMMFRRMLRYC